MNIKDNKGFTLIELLIVVAVIGILASIVVVSLSDQTDVAQDSSTKLGVSSLRTPALAEELQNPSGDAKLCEQIRSKVSSDKVSSNWTTSGGDCDATAVDADDVGTICCASNNSDWVIWGKLSTFIDEGSGHPDYYCADSTGTFEKVNDTGLKASGTAFACK